ncbi:MAG: Hsp70 family protein [Pseudomonadota bacterium]
MHEPRYLNGKRVTFVDVIASFLSHLKQTAQEELEQDFSHALSGRPVRFHSENAQKDAQALKDLTQCYEAAGFKSVHYLSEPEAAAVAAGASKAGELSLIVDIGGGTSDFCLFQTKNDAMQVLATSGVRVGGTDFDRSLSTDQVMPLLGRGHSIREQMGDGALPAPNWIYHELATWEKIPGLYSAKPRALADSMVDLALDPVPFQRLNEALNNELGHDIAFAVEKAKIEANLSGQSRVELLFAGEAAGSRLCAELNGGLMAQSLEPYGVRIRDCALETLKIGQCNARRVDRLIFVGGSSLMKIVEASLAPQFPNATLHYSDAFTAIVDGLAIAAEEL